MTCPKELQDEDGTTPGNYCMIEVKPNWHDSTELLGYYSAMNKEYMFTKFDRFVVKAWLNKDVPFFVCLDEMNLAPVEQYFAEFLSVLETRSRDKEGHIASGALIEAKYFDDSSKMVKELGLDEITGEWAIKVREHIVNDGLTLPPNLMIIGTVNMDDTTYQFSRKVIDRAMTIEMNGGELKNRGYEITVSGKPVAMRDWTLELGTTIGHYDNKVMELPDGNYTNSVYGVDNILVSVGNPVALFYGYKTNGVFASDAEARTACEKGYLVMKDKAGQDVKFGAGDVRFVDLNGDGIINESDKTVIGNPNPDMYGNIFAKLTWKDLTLDLGFNFCLGNDVYNYQRSILNGGSTFYNQQVAEVGHWRYEGQQTDLPRIAYGDPKGNNRFSDRWIENGSYLRLKSMRLTYQIPIPESWQSWLMGLTVWGEAQNIFTITKYKGDDPEFSVGNGVLYQGIDAGYISQCRSFVLGLKINL